MLVISCLAALLAAMTNAASNVLNRMAARDEPPSARYRLRLVRDLLHHRAWFAAIASMIGGFLLSAVALGTGQLAVVQPIIATELPMTLILGARVLHGRVGRPELAASVVMTAGVIGLITVLDPRPGPPRPGGAVAWIVATAAAVAVMAGLLAAARAQRVAGREAALLGIACGIGYGLAAAYTKALTQEYTAGGVTQVLRSWPLYAAVIAGVTATWLLQNAYAAGRLSAAQPGITLADPVTSVLWGALLFGEPVRTGWADLLALLPLALLATGVVLLCRSPVLRETAASPAGTGEAPGPAATELHPAAR